MKNKIKLSLLCVLLIAVLAVGVFAFAGCGAECTEHDFKLEPITASCDKAGLVGRHCSICGYYDEVESPALGHKLTDWETVREATCKESGLKARYCDVCKFKEAEEISKIAHNVEKYTISKTPTESEAGKASGSCKICQSTVQVDLPKLSETSYKVEVLDSESKNYVYTFEGKEIEIFVSNYYFIPEDGDNGEVIGYAIGASNEITSEKIVLPATYKGLPVLRLYSEGFRGQNFKEVVVPEGVKQIDAYAFKECNNLQKITLPSTIKELGNSASGYSKGPIFDEAENIYYDGTVEDWCNIKFYSQFYTGTVSFSDGNGQYQSVTEITIPQSVTAIGNYQFYGFRELETVNFHNNITSIGKCSFPLTAIESLIIPDATTVIGESAFDGCSALSELKITKNSRLESIGENAFSGCELITSIVIPASVVSVGNNAIDCDTVYYMGSANAFENINGKSNLRTQNTTVYYYSEGIPTNSDYTYWHFGDEDAISLWIPGTYASGKQFVYSNSRAEVSDEYFQTLKYLEEMDMLEMMFDANELGPEIAQRMISMVVTSETRTEYETQLSQFSSEAGQNSSYSFGTDGKLTMTVNGQAIPAMSYLEFDNVIYVGGQAVCYIDSANNRIYEKNVSETPFGNTIAWHYYELVTSN